MTLFNLKRFSVPASAGDRAECQRVGHAFADSKGKCVRCAERIRPDPYADLTTEYAKDTEPVNK